MSKILNTLSAIGALAMAATPLVAIGGVAHAADYQPVHIQVADLDLSRTADVSSFRQRVDVAAKRMCGTGPDLSQRAACASAVQEEAVERLGSAQRADLRAAEVSSHRAWRVAAE